MTRRHPLLALGMALVLASCSGDSDEDRLVLDGSPRFPDAEGVVVAVSRTEITLDGDRTYDVSDEIESFSTYDLAATPLLHRKGQYVQVGLDGDEAVWVAGIGVVVDTSDQEPVVFYNGHLLEVNESRARFRDGTVLAVAEGVKAPALPPDGGLVRAEIDPGSHTVVRLVDQSR